MNRMVSAIVTATLTLSALPAVAASDGTLGTTSTGDFNIDLTIPNLIRISSMHDQTLVYTPGAGATVTENFCVYTNALSGTYNVTATSTGDTNNGDTGVFLLDSLSGTMEYTVNYDSTALSEGVNDNRGGLGYSADNLSINCGGTEPVAVIISVAQSEIDAASPDTYTDTLTFLVSPN